MKEKTRILTAVFCFSIGALFGQLFNTANEETNNASNHSNISNTAELPLVNVGISEDESALLIAQLQNEVLSLKNALKRANKAVEALTNNQNTHENMLALTNEALDIKLISNPQLTKASLKSISDEEIISSLPKPFYEHFIDNSNIGLRQKFAQFSDEDIDSDWAYQAQGELEQFILTNNLSYQVELDSIVCKSSICEIRGFEQESDTWSAIMDDLQLKGVGSFQGAYSTSKVSENEENYFYVLLSK